jgi:hypothetical protein
MSLKRPGAVVNEVTGLDVQSVGTRTCLHRRNAHHLRPQFRMQKYNYFVFLTGLNICMSS